jgi:nitrous oxidase accessory protein NosD
MTFWVAAAGSSVAVYAQKEEGKKSSSSSSCVSLDSESKRILITCDATFSDVKKKITDKSILKPEGGGRSSSSRGNSGNSGNNYILDATIIVNDTATFSISSSELKWLKIVGPNSIAVYEGAKINIDGIKITSWDPTTNSVIDENADGTIPRAWIVLYGTEGGHIRNSEISHLGYNASNSGFAGVSLYRSAHDFEISNSDFHHMWFAFYSSGAYNVKIDSSNYHDNLFYALDPHTGTHDMQVTNNQIHDNKGFGMICSLDCYNILIDGNNVYRNVKAGIMLSRNTSNSEVSNNIVHDQPSHFGIFVSQSPNNKIHNNVLTNNLYGIYVRRPTSTDNIIENNSINGSKYGMAFVATTSNTARNNIINNASTFEYYLNNASKLMIDSQQFSPPPTRIRGQTGINEVTIQNSGTIKIAGNNNNNDDMVNTNAKPHTVSLTRGTTITIDSAGSAPALGHSSTSNHNTDRGSSSSSAQRDKGDTSGDRQEEDDITIDS